MAVAVKVTNNANNQYQIADSHHDSEQTDGSITRSIDGTFSFQKRDSKSAKVCGAKPYMTVTQSIAIQI